MKYAGTSSNSKQQFFYLTLTSEYMIGLLIYEPPRGKTNNVVSEQV